MKKVLMLMFCTQTLCLFGAENNNNNNSSSNSKNTVNDLVIKISNKEERSSAGLITLSSDFVTKTLNSFGCNGLIKNMTQQLLHTALRPEGVLTVLECCMWTYNAEQLRQATPYSSNSVEKHLHKLKPLILKELLKDYPTEANRVCATFFPEKNHNKNNK